MSKNSTDDRLGGPRSFACDEGNRGGVINRQKIAVGTNDPHRDAYSDIYEMAPWPMSPDESSAPAAGPSVKEGIPFRRPL